MRGQLRRLGHAQSWRDLLHVLVNFVLATFTFSAAVSWVASGPGGLTYWFWSRWLPDDNQGLPNLLGFPGRFADITFNTILGMIVLISTPVVLRGLVQLHVAVALALLVDETPALRRQVSELTESRTAAGVAEAQTLRRLERDLHDGVQQRLVRLGMDISTAQRRLADDPEQARVLLDEAWQQSQDALAEIRTLSRGIAPPILAEQGLPAAITALAARGTVPTSVDVERSR
jgi:signal transduction histidine kinase